MLLVCFVLVLCGFYVHVVLISMTSLIAGSSSSVVVTS